MVVALVLAGCSSGGSDGSLATEPPDTADQVALTAVPVETEPLTTEPVVPGTEPPGVDNGRDSQSATTEPATSEPSVAPLPAGYANYVSEIYADDANWLCKPGMADDVCARDLDATIVNVPLPSIQATFDANESGIQWVVAAYSLTMGMFMMSAASLSDTRGRRRAAAEGRAVPDPS